MVAECIRERAKRRGVPEKTDEKKIRSKYTL